MMRTLTVALGERSYPIHIGPGLLSQPELVTGHLGGRQVMIVTNEKIAPLYLDAVRAIFSGYQCSDVILPDGEQYKSMETLMRVFDKLLREHCDRAVTIVALGGGVIGDLAGFAAASYQRGVPFIQIPTTLLAQVDSSVGGKTAVNHPLGKNMIGAFHQPRCVIADTDTLATLDDRELHAGIAEVIKYGLIRDREFFEWLEGHIEEVVARSADALIHVIERSCRNKAEVVAADERESGQRALLNLGHTFGHAIETGMGYGSWLHGEAVAAGICAAAKLSCLLGWLETEELERIVALIGRAGLPVRLPVDLDTDRVLELMAVDKKVQAGKLRLVLLHGIGSARVTSEFDPGELRRSIDASRGQGG